MEDGYIKLYRKILSGGMLKKPKIFTFWCWCLLKASHKKHTQWIGNQQIELAPGQFIFGRNKAADELKVNSTFAYRCLKNLENAGNLHIKTNNKFSIVTICNWGHYQGKNTKNEQQNEQQVNNKRTTNEQQMNTNKKGKKGENGKNGKKKETASCPEPSGMTHGQEEIFITIPLIDKTEYGVTESYMEEMKQLYPAVDIEQELRKIKGWNLSNPINRKTRRGIKKHINGWLSREQDSARPKGKSGGVRPKAQPTKAKTEEDEQRKREFEEEFGIDMKTGLPIERMKP